MVGSSSYSCPRLVSKIAGSWPELPTGVGHASQAAVASDGKGSGIGVCGLCGLMPGQVESDDSQGRMGNSDTGHVASQLTRCPPADSRSQPHVNPMVLARL